MSPAASAPAGAVARYAVIGHPVSHSRSPWIHARFAAQTQQALTYTAIDSPEDAFAATLQRERAAGLAGANVTVPFKLQAHDLAGLRTPRAALARAANTLWWVERDGRSVLQADNTDGVGLVRDLTRHAGCALRGRRVLLLGAGGASAGVLGVLIEQGPASITVANRTLDKATRLVQRHAAHAAAHGTRLHVCTLEAVLADPQADPQPCRLAGGSADALAAEAPPPAFDVVLNGTSSSLGGEPLCLPRGCFAPGSLACDMMYGAAARPFLQHAAACGAQTRDGLGMLVEQAAEAFRLWRGVAPDTAPVLRELRALVDQGLTADAGATPSSGVAAPGQPA